jgi:hypothetical protein
MMKLKKWLLNVWPNPHAGIEVVHGYADLQRYPLVLADIARRGGVYARTVNPDNATLIAWNEGRRCLALEILEQAEMTPAQVAELIKIYVSKPKDDDDGR